MKSGRKKLICKKLRQIYKSKIFLTVFIVAVPVIFHFLFSHLGFNPSDDGFILAYARRALEGEIPHKDYISLRPQGSGYLHALLLLISGNSVFLISRLFVLFQFGIISWSWVKAIENITKDYFGIFESILIYIIGFIFSIHTFPIMAWNTIDGLFFLSFGTWLATSKNGRIKILGFLTIGTSVLFRQNFVFYLPIAYICLSRLKEFKNLINLLIPAALYVLFLAYHSALAQALFQISSSSNLKMIGFDKYIQTTYFFPFIAGGFVANLLVDRFREGKLKFMSILAGLSGFGVLFASLFFMNINGLLYVFSYSFSLFGLIFGIFVYNLIVKKKKMVRAGFLVLIACWSLSLSFGYNSPALSSAGLVVLIIVIVRRGFYLDKNNKDKILSNIYQILLISLTIYSLYVFGNVRTNQIYREQKADKLIYSLSGVFPGARNIKTNKNMYLYLKDLGEVVDNTQGEYVILPKLSAWWAQSDQKNPLPVELFVSVEFKLNEPSLLDWVYKTLEKKRGRLTVIIPKVEVASLAYGFYPLYDNDNYMVMVYVRKNWDKTGESEYFELYE